MKKFFTKSFLISLLFIGGTTFLGAQTTVFGSTGPLTDITGSPCPANEFTAVVTGVGEITSSLDNVTIDITHTWDGDLDISLLSPGGVSIALSQNNGGSGDDYTNTQFEDGGIDGPISGGTPPFTGIFDPEMPLSTFDGECLDGDWILSVCDEAAGDVGNLNSWSLSFTNGSGSPCIPLPTELISFDGQTMKEGNKLTWATASEVGTQFHVIERSHNGVDSWREIGRVEASGTSTNLLEYSFMDDAPLVKGYYRLNSIDYDRSEQISEVLALEREVDGFGIANAFPNPTNSSVTVQYYSPKNSEVSVVLRDIAGRIIQNFEEAANDGFNSMNINMIDMASGTYFLSLSNDVNKVVERIVKQ